MNIEEKAKRYDKALEKARQLCVYPTSKSFISDLQDLFPELKESEDEKIRKNIINWLKNIEGQTIPINEYNAAVAYLEKQGTPAKLSAEEQNKFAKGVLSSCALSFINYLDAHRYEGKMDVSNGECEDIENAFNNAMWDRLHRYYCKYIEKQGEQKSFDYEKAHIQQNDFVPKSAMEAIKGEIVDNANKAKPKFKADNWIIYDRHISKVKDMDSEGYLVEDTYGDESVLPKEFAEKHYRLWTIQDAKDGDVLAEDSCIFILKEVVNFSAAITYCTLFDDGEFHNGETLYFDIDSTKPATKEQRDQLEKVMADAGYTFDFEKKELKKIEQKTEEYNITGISSNKSQGKLGEIIKNLKHTWSEEDE